MPVVSPPIISSKRRCKIGERPMINLIEWSGFRPYHPRKVIRSVAVMTLVPSFLLVSALSLSNVSSIKKVEAATDVVTTDVVATNPVVDDPAIQQASEMARIFKGVKLLREQIEIVIENLQDAEGITLEQQSSYVVEFSKQVAGLREDIGEGFPLMISIRANIARINAQQAELEIELADNPRLQDRMEQIFNGKITLLQEQIFKLAEIRSKLDVLAENVRSTQKNLKWLLARIIHGTA